jgi:hypothetical protein
MTCTPLQTELTQLRARRSEQAEVVDGLPNNPGRQHAEEVLAGIDADIASTQAELNLCLQREQQAQNPVPQNISAKVDRIVCHSAQDSSLVHDNPYLLIASFDMFQLVIGGVVSATLPDINVVKVGPWMGVDRDETHDASELAAQDRRAFWDLDGHARPIAQPQDVIFLVGLLENDGSSPDALRGGVRTDLRTALLANVGRSYSAYVSNMISNMKASIDTRTIAIVTGGLNVDELFGVQHLALTTDDLAQLNNLEAVQKSLRFTYKNRNGKVQSDYTVFFSFTV